MVSSFLRFTRTISRRKARQRLEEAALVKVLMVCRANICSSPMAEGAFQHLLDGSGLNEMIFVDSAGTHTQQNGIPADQRGVRVAGRRGISLAEIRSRRLETRDLDRFDYILAMDRDNQEDLLELCEASTQREKIHLLMSFAPEGAEPEVPDPYFGALTGFERVMDMLEISTQGVLAHIRERYRL